MQAREKEIPNNKALWVLVITMGVLILIGVAVVIVAIANRLGGTVDRSATPSTGAFGNAELPVPAGCEIVETMLEGERLLLRLGTAGRCRRLLVVDLATGRLLGTLDLVPAGP